MADINDVLHIARVFKSQAEADLMNDTYSKVLPTNMISFCDAVKELLKEKQPPKGHWINTTVRGSLAHVCSVCGLESGTLYDYAFCPFCGADMRGEQE